MNEIEPDSIDKESLKLIASNKDQSTVTHEELIKDIEYSGKISLRIPKSLHAALVDQAKQEGISLNQYILYRLSHK